VDLKRLIRLFYIGYTVYAICVVDITTLELPKIATAIVLMWINYFAFSVGFRARKRETMAAGYECKSNRQGPFLLRCNKGVLFLFAALSIAFSVSSARFYTGQTPFTVMQSLMENTSLYNAYQMHFRDANVGLFSLAKAPYILMQFYLKYMLFYSYISMLMNRVHLGTSHKAYLALITVSFVYIGVARGTNFEFFELVMLVIFVLFSRAKGSGVSVRFAALVKTVSLVGLMVYLFYIRLASRGIRFDYYFSPDVQYNPNGLIPALSPFLAFVVHILYGYFGFGFHYISTFITELWFSSVLSFFAGLVPLGYQLMFGESVESLMRELVYMGVRWHPDLAMMTHYLGYVGVLMVCFGLGYFAKYISLRFPGDAMTSVSCFVILLQMVSFPVGQFVVVSSASLLTVMLLLFIWTERLMLRTRLVSKPVASRSIRTHHPNGVNSYYT
jgi:hypothetical protein